MSATQFPIWKTIQIGGKSKEQLLVEMRSKGCRVGEWGGDMIERETFTTLPESVEIQLVRITIREMGLEIPVGPRRIWKRAEDLHLSLCPPEVSLHLLIDDAAPEKYEEYWIGMKPIITSGGDPRVFGIERDIGRRDLSSYGTCGVWYTYSPLVFVAPDD